MPNVSQETWESTVPHENENLIVAIIILKAFRVGATDSEVSFTMERNIFATVQNVDDTFYGKYMKNQRKILELAISDPKSYASVVVKAVDHFVTASAMMEDHCGEVLKSVCVETILREYADGLRASEIFAIWLPDVRQKLQSIAGDVIKRETKRSSAVDRNARICYGILMIQKCDLDSIRKAIKFNDISRKKYPTEIFFWRTYCYLFTFTKDWESGLKASDEACQLFPTDESILNARASMLRMMTDVGNVDYVNWSKQKKQAEEVKQAFKDYLKIARKDHRHFAENNYLVAYFAFKYAAPSSEMMLDDIREITHYYQNGLKAENDIIPCFLPYTSEPKQFVAAHVNIQPTMSVFVDSRDSRTAHVTFGPPKTGFLHINETTYINMRMPTKRRIDACVEHRRRLKDMLSDPAVASLVQLIPDNNTSPIPSPLNCDDYEELILHQMTMTKVSRAHTSKMIQLTMVEDFIYSSSRFETVVADTTGDVIKLLVNLGAERPENHRLKEIDAEISIWNGVEAVESGFSYGEWRREYNVYQSYP
ncbi:hypothetical protein HA402_000313 [Bradysia odoriphaga]|nr:hypothetical protein HA402_000313 [Bradysia odoriphaga]